MPTYLTRFERIRHVFHGLILLISIVPVLYIPRPPEFREIEGEIPFMMFRILLVIPFYLINAYYLVPKFLSSRKYLHYAVSLLVGLALFSILITFWNHFFHNGVVTSIRFERNPPGIGFGRDLPKEFFILRRLPPILPFLMLMGIGTSFEMILTWEKQQQKFAEAEKERMDTELRFLRTQINPHFFFNTLNSIYSLAIEKSDDTQKAILILSNLMRYVLYESNTRSVRLEQEIEFLKDYITLQQMRMSDEMVPEIKFDLTVSDPDATLPPILLIPIVENAFKYSKSYTERPKITIRLQAREGILLFHVSNSVGELADSKDEFSGIGLKNIQRRLDLIYPNDHQLTAQSIDNYFVVDLSINYKGAKDPE